jgi:hypothetical protein
MDLSISAKVEIWVPCVCHQVSNELYYMNVCGQPHTTPALTFRKMPMYQLNRRLDGPEIWPGSSVEVENLMTL